MTLYPYDRQAAVDYAHRWAYHRNPDFYSFDELGGDCTNFASQCLYAGAGVMDYTPTFGWYYNSQYSRAPAWTGVPFFYNFLTRKKETPGPVGEEAEPAGLLPGDFAQLRFAPGPFAHNPVIVSVGSPPALDNILVAAHSEDADYRPLSTYPIQGVRFLHIVGVRR
ncbi:MAG: amidase domain-containing protein [Oscillospiraceae bacterium]|jgi:hypothetical protein|nr:amidase domain-containing protein [Oscillospiraceae bacterium]